MVYQKRVSEDTRSSGYQEDSIHVPVMIAAE
jgi:hypothetical protein